MSSDDSVAPRPSSTRRILGVCWAVYGVICLIMAIFLVLPLVQLP
jgi:hypothetical protein